MTSLDYVIKSEITVADRDESVKDSQRSTKQLLGTTSGHNPAINNLNHRVESTILEVGSDVANSFDGDILCGNSSLPQAHDGTDRRLHAIPFSRDNQNLLGDFDVLNHV